MSAPSGQMLELQRLLATKEPLHPALALWLRPGAFGAPMLNHPLVQCGFYHEAENAMLNRAYKYKVERLAKAKAEGDWHTAVFLHERPYRTEALAEMAGAIPDNKTYWEVVSHVWSDTENFWQNATLWRKLLRATPARRLERAMMMTEMSERAEYAALPGRFKVWRGGSSAHPRAAKSGLSWTLDYKTACWFSGRFLRPGEQGMVYEREVFKRDVVAVLNGRGEREVVVLTDKTAAEPLLVESIGREVYKRKHARHGA